MQIDDYKHLSKPVRWVADEGEIMAEPNGRIAIDDAKSAIFWWALRLTAKRYGLSPEQFSELTNLRPDHAAIQLISRLVEEFVPGSRLEVRLTDTQKRNRDLARYILDGIARGRWQSEREATRKNTGLSYNERSILGFRKKKESAIRSALREGKKLL